MSVTNRHKMDNKNDECSQRIKSYKNTRHGPSDRIRTCGILLPKQARYQLRYTRLFRYFIRLVVFSPKTSALPIGPLPDACRALYTIREEKATRKYVSTD